MTTSLATSTPLASREEAISWPPLRPEDFDRAATLTPAERTALLTYQAVGKRSAATLTGEIHAAHRALARLLAPLETIHARLGVGPDEFPPARHVLSAEMLRRDCTFWAWTAADWLAVCGASARAFTAQYGVWASRGRHHLLALAYLTGVTDLRPLGLGLACMPVARAVFGPERLAAAFARLSAVLHGRTGLGYSATPDKRQRLDHVLALVLLLNGSPSLEDLSVAFLQRLAAEVAESTALVVRQIGRGLGALGLLVWPSSNPAPVRPTAADGVPPVWAAWCWAWYERAVNLGPRPRHEVLYALFAVGRWLQATHPSVLTPEQWDEDLALEYVHYLCTAAQVGADASPTGREHLARRNLLGKPLSPRAISGRLNYLRRAFADWQDLPHAVAGAPARRIPVRFKPSQAFATPRPIRALVRPEPRDIDLGLWYKLAYAAATVSAQHLAQRGQHYYPVTLYRALALLWVTAARRPDELRRLRLGCVRREWDPLMRDEDGRPLDRAAGEMCYLQVPPNKTQGAFWIWIPTYTAEAIAAWERERPTNQSGQLDPKDHRRVDYLFQVRGRILSGRFLNRFLIPLLCAVAGVPERDARGQLTAHRGRSTRATLLRRLGVPLADIAAYLGHSNPNTVRYYARTDDTQLALTIQRADERSRLVEAVFDPQAAAQGAPSLYFSLGRGPDGTPRYCANPAWASCAHRLACLKCRMYVGGTTADLLEARDGIIRLQTTVPMTPEEHAAAEGDLARLTSRLAELRQEPPPDPPSAAFVFNPAPSPAPAPADPSSENRQASLTARLAELRQDLAATEQAGKRSVLVQALRRQIVKLEDELAAVAPAPIQAQEVSNKSS